MKNNVTLEVISPIHISGKEKLSNMEYIIRGGKFYVLDIDKMLDSISSNEELLRSLKDCDIVNIVDSIGVDKIASYALKSRLNESYSGEVYQFIRHVMPYIPGSSIKGSVRSAMLYYRLKRDSRYLEEHLSRLSGIIKRKPYLINRLRRSAARDLEDIIFRNGSRDMHYDKLRYLSVSDMYVDDTIDNILELSEVAILPTSLRLIMEVLKKGCKFYGQIDIKSEIDIDEVKESCKVFANDIIDYELKNIDKYKEYKDSIKDFYKELRDVSNKHTLIRVGRQGHYSITIGILLYEKLKEYNLSWLVQEPINRKVCIGNGVMPLGWLSMDIS